MLTVTIEEPGLLDAACGGDADACERLLRPLYPSILSLARARLRRLHDAQDAAQETFARVLKGIHGYRPDATFARWVFTIAANVIRDMIRRARVRQELPPPPPLETLDPASALQKSESLDRVMGAIEQLDPDESAPLLLHLVHGVPQAEIAQHLDIPVEHLRVRLYRTIRKIRQAVSEEDR